MAKILAALLLLVAIPACGGASTPAGGGTISPSDFPAAAVDAICSHDVRCGLMPDQATCVAARIVDMGQALADVGAGKIVYDSNQAAACLDALRSASCHHLEGEQTSPQACWDVFKGMVADGGVCYIGLECMSGTCVTKACPASVCCPGACAPSASSARPIPIGGNCNGASSGCIDGAFCAGTCYAKAAVGQSCDETYYAEESCVTGMYCSWGGICGTLSAEGQPCHPSPDGIACDSMLDYCDSVTLTCLPRIVVGGDCSAGESCVAYADCEATGRCVARGRSGESCDEPNGLYCLGSLVCNSGTCVRPRARPVCQ